MCDVCNFELYITLHSIKPSLYISISFVLVNCPPGSQGVTGSMCAQCAIDAFQDQQGQITCKPCPSGQGTYSTGAVECAGENNCLSTIKAVI